MKSAFLETPGIQSAEKTNAQCSCSAGETAPLPGQLQKSAGSASPGTDFFPPRTILPTTHGGCTGFGLSAEWDCCSSQTVQGIYKAQNFFGTVSFGGQLDAWGNDKHALPSSHLLMRQQVAALSDNLGS